MSAAWGDYDNDERPDLVVSTFQYEPTSLYHNQGHGAFVEEAFPAGIGDATLNRLGFGIKFFDADNDGDLDLIQANGHVQDNADRLFPGVTYRQSTLLFENLGDRRFRDISAAAGAALARPIVGRGLAVGDYDSDGSVDVLIANLEGGYTTDVEGTAETEWRGSKAVVHGSYTWSHYYGNFDQDNTTGCPPCRTTSTTPSAVLRAVSMESLSRDRSPARTIRRSTTTAIS